MLCTCKGRYNEWLACVCLTNSSYRKASRSFIKAMSNRSESHQNADMLNMYISHESACISYICTKRSMLSMEPIRRVRVFLILQTGDWRLVSGEWWLVLVTPRHEEIDSNYHPARFYSIQGWTWGEKIYYYQNCFAITNQDAYWNK